MHVKISNKIICQIFNVFYLIQIQIQIMLRHVLQIIQLKYGMFHRHSIGLLLQHIQNIQHLFGPWNGWTMTLWLLLDIQIRQTNNQIIQSSITFSQPEKYRKKYHSHL